MTSTMRIENGNKVWRNEQNMVHRLDGPAIERADGSKYWYQKDQLHRLDGPAVEYTDGSKIWYQNGQRHRLDGPAIERAGGLKEWYFEGKQYHAVLCFRKGQTITKKPIESKTEAYKMMCDNLSIGICSWVETLK